MGNPAIYWWPAEGAGAHRISFSEPWADWQETPERTVASGDTGDVSSQRIDYGGRFSLRLVYEGFTDRALAAELRSLQSHLAAGFPVAFAADRTKTWAGFAEHETLKAGKTSIATTGNLFLNLEDVVSLTANDYFALHSANPLRMTEEHKIAGYDATNGVITLGSGKHTFYNHSKGPVLIRHEWFWPVMYLPEDMASVPIVTAVGRRVWTMDLTLVESPADYGALYDEATGTTISSNMVPTNAGMLAAPGALGFDVSVSEQVFDDSAVVNGLKTLQDMIANGNILARTESVDEASAVTEPAWGTSDYYRRYY